MSSKKGTLQMGTAKRRVKFRMAGRVQGVAFRASALDEAERLGISGWIRNRPTGEVEGEAEGDATLVDAFVAWCKDGPRGARVDHCDVQDEEYVGNLRGFEIRR
jgi:acylphosphatase